MKNNRLFSSSEGYLSGQPSNQLVDLFSDLSKLGISNTLQTDSLPSSTLNTEIPSSSIPYREEPSKDLSFFLDGPRGSFVISDIVTSVLALIGNLLILLALTRTKLAVGGYRQFLLSLLAADIFMVTTVMLAVLHQYLSSYFRLHALEQCGNLLLRSLTLVSYFVSLLTIAGLTIDNFIGVFYQLHYRNWMASHRVKRIVVLIWALSFLLGFADPMVALLNLGFSKISKQQSSPTIKHSGKGNNNAWSALDQLLLKPVITGDNNNAASASLGEETDDINYAIINFAFHSGKNGLSHLDQERTSDALPGEIRFDYPLSRNENAIIVEPEQSATRNTVKMRNLINDVLELVETQQCEIELCHMSRFNGEKLDVEFFVIGLTIPCFVLLLVIYCCIVVKVMLRRKHHNVISSVKCTSNNAITQTQASLAVAESQQTISKSSKSRKNTGFSNKSLYGNTAVFSNQQNNSRLALTTLLLISSFAFCWVSFIMFELFVFIRSRAEHDQEMSSSATVDKEGETLLFVNSVFNSLLMLSPLINPIIYAARLPRVRTNVIRMITCQRTTRTGKQVFSLRVLVANTTKSNPLLLINGNRNSSIIEQQAEFLPKKSRESCHSK